MTQFGFGPIYDPDDAEKLIETYLEHGDVMGSGDKAASSGHEDDDSEQEAREDE